MNEEKLLEALTVTDVVTSGKLWLKNSEEEEKKRSLNILDSLINVISTENIESTNFDIISFITVKINELNQNLSKYIDQIIHNEDFRKLEGKWRGFYHLVMNSETGQDLKIKAINISDSDLKKDLLKAIEFDQSKLFKMVYEEEYGTYGGSSFSCFIYDYYFNSTNSDVEFATKLSSVFASSHCPIISSVCPTMFNIENFKDINKARDIGRIFQTPDKILWNSFRKKNDSKYLALTLPRVIARTPYSVENNPCNGVEYNETTYYDNDDDFVWMNAAYTLGTRISSAFSLYGWTAAIRGVEGGGLCEDLAAYIYTKEEGDKSIKCPTEISITDRREKELSDLGFVTLCHCKGTNKAAFFSVQTIHQPEEYDNKFATANARMSVSLPYLLVASRFSHYIVTMLRNKIGSFQTHEEMQNYLQRWLSNYVLLNPSASQEMKAEMPLKEASVEVVENPGMVGSYSAIIRITPHFQFEDMSVSMRLVSRVPEKPQ